MQSILADGALISWSEGVALGGLEVTARRHLKALSLPLASLALTATPELTLQEHQHVVRPGIGQDLSQFLAPQMATLRQGSTLLVSLDLLSALVVEGDAQVTVTVNSGPALANEALLARCLAVALGRCSTQRLHRRLAFCGLF